MKILLSVLLACVSGLPIFARQLPDLFTRGTFVLQGKVKNHTQPFFEIGLTGYFGTRTESVSIAKGGSFSKTISTVNTADLYFDIDGADATYFAQPGDVLEVSWDDNTPAGSFRIVCKKPGRQPELDQQTALARGRYSAMKKMHEQLDDKTLSEQDKFNLIKDQFVAQLQTALQFPITANSKKVYADIYYRHMQLLYESRLLSKYRLHVTDVMSIQKRDSLDLASLDYQTVDEPLFLLSEVYRDFIFDQVRFNKPFYGFRTLGQSEASSNFTLKDCYSGAAALSMAPLVQDWFLTKALIFGFGYYSFEGSELAYNQFSGFIKNSYFRDTLTKFYAAIQRLRRGNAAPDISLKNTAGKTVSLSDFKNKVVYIDFWGVSCGPCIYEIKNHAATLHARYKDKDVVFLNICIDATDKTWKENLKKLNFEGIHLLAEGANRDRVCVDYNVDGIPQYVLIDKQGKIANHNAGRPSEQLRKNDNEIDALLK